MITLYYASKKEMIEKLMGTKDAKKTSSVGEMKYDETSMFGAEVSDNCRVCGCNRPSSTRIMTMNAKGVRSLAKEFYADITIKNGIITSIK